MEDTRLGSILLESGLISEADLERCLSLQALTGSVRPIGQILVEQGAVDAEALKRVLELQQARSAERALKSAPADAMSESLLQSAQANGASEMIVSEGRKVRIRVAGKWRDLTDAVVSGPEVWDFAREVLGAQVLEEAAERKCVTRAWRHARHGRGTARAFRHFEGVAVSLTFVADEIDNCTIGLPERLIELVTEGRGLILVAGECGTRRAEVLTALTVASATDPGTHVIVVDDEELVLPETPALLGRRRLGKDAASRAHAVRSAVTEDPDVLVIADVGEVATFEVALRAAEDGRLVIGYIGATSVIAAISRILDFYAVYDVPRVRASLANVLRALLVRHSLPHSDGTEAVTATELLLPDDPVRDALRGGELGNISLMMRMSGGSCGHSLDHSMLELVTSGAVRLEDAFARADEKAWLLERTRGLATSEN
ncbi:MAG: Flp pilus assembly complex ATPase component TadA [Planctomycetes bacterium]|nr:Flp pilus assembly complex ATPase component TadA [Planctomycetota bacterium]